MNNPTNQINKNIIRTQNQRLIEQTKLINALKDRNSKLCDLVWMYYLETKMWRGLVDYEQGRW